MRASLHRVIEWLTGFDEAKLQELIREKVTFEELFPELVRRREITRVWESGRGSSKANDIEGGHS